MKFIRAVLGKIILWLDTAFSPKSMVRDAQTQSRVDEITKTYTLYQLEACPFCVKVRREIKRLGLNIKIKDVGTDPQAFQELMSGGKIDQVPCLKMDRPDGTATWMYESSEINQFLRMQFRAE